MYITETQLQIMTKGLLEPGEQLVSRSVVVEAPWWTMGIIFLHKTYLVLATNQRMILVEHNLDFFGRGHKAQAVHSIPWAQVQELKMKGIFRKKLRIVAQSQTRVFKGNMKIPNALFGLLAPVKQNMMHAKQIAQQGAASKQLSAPPSAYGSLPPGSVAPQMQQQYAQQQYQQQQGYPQQGYPQQYPQNGGGYYPQA